MTETGLVEGDTTAPVAAPADVLHFDTPFLTDIAHNAAPNAGLVPDDDTTASADFASQPVGTYDDEMLNLHFIAGDGRVNENIGLTALHQVFHSEHDRLVGQIKDVLANDTTDARGRLPSRSGSSLKVPPAGTVSACSRRPGSSPRWNTSIWCSRSSPARFSQGINPFEPFAFTQTDLNPAVRAEFAHAVYRFGHSMLAETTSRTNEDGSSNDISLLEGFLNPPSYTDGGSVGPLNSAQAAGSVIIGMSDQVGNELDKFVTEICATISWVSRWTWRRST